jgi:nicotinate phosphoribosyltransferase
VNSFDIQVVRHYPEGALVAPETPLFSYTGEMRHLVELETMLLQRVGFACISGYNAYQMSMACPKVPFLDMAARHCAPDDGEKGMIASCAYGAATGSKTARMHGAKGFIGSSLDLTAPWYGAAYGLGTMPHALIGLHDSTAKALEAFVDCNPDDPFIVALVDYYGQEYSDALECARWFKNRGRIAEGTKKKKLGVRLDTTGNRFAEGLDYDKSVAIVGDWLHIHGKWPIVEHVVGEEVYDLMSDDVRDDIAKILFGTGVSAANIIQMRLKLDQAGHKDVQIVASSGFDVRKCRVMARAHAPIDLIGTGSFLPDTTRETYATTDIFAYDGKFRVKVGREEMFREVANQIGIKFE